MAQILKQQQAQHRQDLKEILMVTGIRPLKPSQDIERRLKFNPKEGKNQCACCEEDGHWVKNCPKKGVCSAQVLPATWAEDSN